MDFHNDLILFFKRHNLYNEEMFNYFKENTTMIDYEDELQRTFIGCFYIFDKKHVLIKIHLNIPYIYDEITTLICIHELIHGIELYKKLNTKAKVTDECEILPMLYEKIYVEENQNENLIKYHKKIDSLIDLTNERYFIALATREELYSKYNYNIKKMQKEAKKLSKKYKHKLN